MERRVVITGTGVISPIGMDARSAFDSAIAGRHGFAPVTGFDGPAMGIHYYAPVKDFQPEAYGIGKKDARRMDRFTQMACAAADQAIAMSGIKSCGLDPFRIGTIVGSGIGGFDTFIQEHKKYLEKGPDRVSVFFIPTMISNMAAGMIAIRNGFKGVNYCPVTACATSTHAVGEAFRSIKHGYIDAAVAGGSEAALNEFAVAGFNNMGALSGGSDIDRLSIPFDKERSGFAIGEGAAIVVLEEYEHARARGAKIYGEIVGYGASADAYHITSPAPDGEAAAYSMRMAYTEAGIAPEEVGYINAHGTSTIINDKYETVAIKKALGKEAASRVAISSTKSVSGHLLGAAGTLEVILSAMSLAAGTLPPTAGYRIPDVECDLDYIPGEARRTETRYALSNSFGFGGQNSTICIRRYDD